MVINSLRHYGQCNLEIYRIYSAYFIRFRVSVWFEFPLRGGGVQRRHGGLREGPELPGGAAGPRGVRPLRAAAADGCRRMQTVQHHVLCRCGVPPCHCHVAEALDPDMV